MNDFKIAKLDGQDILKDWISWIYYTFKEWRKLSTSDDSRNIDGVHGRTTSPTYARIRIITIEWFIDRVWNASEIDAVRYLENIFALQGNLWTLEKKLLYIKDIYDQEWKINVKIKDPLEVLEWDEEFIWSYWKWRIVLESTDTPIYKSYEEIIVSWEEGTFGGFTLPITFPLSWDTSESIIECVTTGNTSTPAKFVITAIWDINSPLKVMNITNNTYFSLDISAVSWDVIIIDSNTKTATKNGVSVLWDRVSWSIWQTISGTTQFVLEDLDGWITSDDFDVQVYFNNSLL